MEYFGKLGVPLKTERGRRVFPVSDRAGDVVSALEGQLRKLNVEVIKGNCTRLLIEDGACCGAVISGREVRAGAVVLATGGASYPLTGSDGSGYALARPGRAHGDSPGAFPYPDGNRGALGRRAAGLDLRNISMRLTRGGKPVYEDFGELLFTAYGIGGPTMLSASAHIPEIKPGEYAVEIDLKPALSEKKLDDRIIRDFAERRGMRFAESLRGTSPGRSWLRSSRSFRESPVICVLTRSPGSSGAAGALMSGSRCISGDSVRSKRRLLPGAAFPSGRYARTPWKASCVRGCISPGR